MKIAVCIKQVPVVSMLRFDNETRRMVREGVPNEVNPYDVLGISLAARLKAEHGAEVVVLTMGPPQASEALVQAMAMGADYAIHLNDRAFAGSDTLATARALSLALEREECDLIICGRNSADSETGQVGHGDSRDARNPTDNRRLQAGHYSGRQFPDRNPVERRRPPGNPVRLSGSDQRYRRHCGRDLPPTRGHGRGAPQDDLGIDSRRSVPATRLSLARTARRHGWTTYSRSSRGGQGQS